MPGANKPKNVILAILVAVAVWAVSFFLFHWTKIHVPLALLVAILGALLTVVILLATKKYELTGDHSTTGFGLVTIGSAIGIAASSLVVTCIHVNVSCSQQPAYATPDETTAYQFDSICWKPSNVNYTVEFKQSNVYGAGNGGRRSPVRKLASAEEEVFVTVLTSASQTRQVNVPWGYFWYDIKCVNGNHVDPKVRVPPR
jgi:hypothetical protein